MFEPFSAEIASFQIDGNCLHYVGRQRRKNVWRNTYTNETMKYKLHDGTPMTAESWKIEKVEKTLKNKLKKLEKCWKSLENAEDNKK